MNRLLEVSAWVPPAVAATEFEVPHWTVRSWMRRLKVRSICIKGGALLVNWHDVRRLANINNARTLTPAETDCTMGAERPHARRATVASCVAEGEA